MEDKISLISSILFVISNCIFSFRILKEEYEQDFILSKNKELQLKIKELESEIKTINIK